MIIILLLLLFCVLGFWPTTSKRYTNYLYSKSFSPAWPLCSSEICRQQNHIIQGKGKYLIHEKLHSKCACLYYVQWCIYNFQNETSTFFFFWGKTYVISYFLCCLSPTLIPSLAPQHLNIEWWSISVRPSEGK